MYYPFACTRTPFTKPATPTPPASPQNTQKPLHEFDADNVRTRMPHADAAPDQYAMQMRVRTCVHACARVPGVCVIERGRARARGDRDRSSRYR